MQVSSKAVCGIVLRIVADLADKTGRIIEEQALGERWKDVGLRQSDLERAVYRLQQGGELRQLDRQRIALTARGRCRAMFLSLPLWCGVGEHERLRRLAAERRQRHIPS